MPYAYLTSKLTVPLLLALTLTACQKNPDTKTTSPNANSAGLVGCYTTMKTEPAQIKINEQNGRYTMQMREFNDPDKPWDKPEPLQTLAQKDIKVYFDVDEKSVENAVIRPDKVFALAKVQDSLMNLDSRFDSNYLGFIYKGSNTIYKVECGQ